MKAFDAALTEAAPELGADVHDAIPGDMRDRLAVMGEQWGELPWRSGWPTLSTASQRTTSTGRASDGR